MVSIEQYRLFFFHNRNYHVEHEVRVLSFGHIEQQLLILEF